MTRREQLQETLCNRLFWHTAERDDAKVADHVFHRREMDIVYAMDEATLFEGTNNKIKTMQKQAYGFRDMVFFKLKIMALHEAKYALVG